MKGSAVKDSAAKATPRPALALAALGLSALLAGCKPATDAKKNDLDAPPTKSTALAVALTQANAGALSVNRSASATVSALRDSNVATSVGGAVQQVLVSEGQNVQPGEAAVQLDDTTQRQAVDNAQVQLRQAQIGLQQARTTTQRSDTSLSASVRSAQAALEQAQANADSTETLARLGGVSQADLQGARAQLAQAQSTLAQARQSLAQNGQSAQNSVPTAQTQVESAQVALRQAQENLRRTVVRVPFAGTVADVNVEQGEYAQPGSAVFRLVDTGSLRIKFSVPATDAAALRPGTTFNLGYGGRNYVGQVVDSSGIAGTNRLVPVTASLQGGAALPVGATAQARYRVTLAKGVLVPSTAVESGDQGSAVYTVEGGVAHRQSVSVIAESDGRVALSNLEAGTQVINPLLGSLQDGVAVKVGQANTADAGAAQPQSGPSQSGQPQPTGANP